MKPSEDPLISHIKQTLAVHEEPYRAGAWEKFNESTAKKKKQGFGIYQFLNVAAMLLVCAFIFLYVDKVGEKPAQQIGKSTAKPQTAPKLNTPQTIESKDALKENQEMLNSTDLAASRAPGRSRTAIDPRTTIAPLETVNLDHALAKNYKPSASGVTQNLQDPPVNAAMDQRIMMQVKPTTPTVDRVEPLARIKESEEKAPAKSASSFEDFLKKEQLAKNKDVGVEKSKSNMDKWELGLMVAPSIGNSNKLNLGYGLSMGYALSKKLSVVSGLSYNDMTASNQVAAPVNTASIITGTAKNLESVEADVSGIDIPIGIKYNLSKKVYANVGVSAFAVLNQRQKNTYLQESATQSFSTDPESLGEIRMLLNNQRVTEAAPENAVNNTIIGFYNISFGFKQPLSKKNSLSLEPFLKLPMKETGPENLKLIGTGIKLKLDF